MKVKAKHNLILDGVLYNGGEIFEVENLDGLTDHVEEVGYISDVFPPEQEEKPKRKSTRSRKKTD